MSAEPVVDIPGLVAALTPADLTTAEGKRRAAAALRRALRAVEGEGARPIERRLLMLARGADAIAADLELIGDRVARLKETAAELMGEQPQRQSAPRPR